MQHIFQPSPPTNIQNTECNTDKYRSVHYSDLHLHGSPTRHMLNSGLWPPSALETAIFASG